MEKEAYLSHYGMKKSGNKPELIKRIEEHMLTVYSQLPVAQSVVFPHNNCTCTVKFSPSLE